MTKPQFQFRPLAEYDVPLLFDWLNRPHLAEWWDGPVSLTAVREKHLPRIGSASVRPYLAFLNGTPVGFIQSYVAVEQGDGWWPDERDPGVIGIDQFLADADSLGKGLGTEMVSQFVRLLFQNPEVTRIQTDPAPRNLRAIRCYEKVGFRRIGVIETPEGPALLMVINRAPVATRRS
jgi:aminoglycoside 6'-N-acetyltransferase-1b